MATLAEEIRAALLEVFLPVTASAQYQSGWRSLLSSLGHTDQLASDPELRTALEQTSSVVKSVAALDSNELLSWKGLQSLIQLGSQVNDAVRALRNAVSDPALLPRIEHLGEELMEVLVARYLRDNHAVLYRVSSVLTLVTPVEFAPVEPAEFDGTTVTRLPWRRSRFQFDRIGDLLSDPWRTLRESYFPNDLAEAVDAHHAAAQLFPQLGALADALGLSWRSDLIPTSPPPSPDPPQPDDPILTMDHFATDEDKQPDVVAEDPPSPDLTAYYESLLPRFLLGVARSDESGTPHFGLGLILSSVKHPGGTAGVIVTPVGSFGSTEDRGSWRITITSNGQLAALLAGPDGFMLAPSSNLTGGLIKILLERIPDAGSTGPAFVFGSPTGTRLEFGTVQLSTDVVWTLQKATASVMLAASSGAVVIVSSDGDGFLRKVLPQDGMRFTFDAGLGLSSDRGFTFKGSGGLECDLPIGLSIGSLFSIPSLHLAIRAGGEGLQTEVSCAAAFKLGPLDVMVDRVGLVGQLSFPDGGGNLGVADFGLGFQPPQGLSLGLEFEPAVHGSGTLVLQQNRYFGAFSLHVGPNFGIDLLALLETSAPGEADSFSLLLSGVATFPGIPIGFGFELQRLGAILGINRRLNTPALLVAIQTGMTQGLLTPPRPDQDPSALITQLAAILPRADSVYVIGLLVGFGWARPTLATFDFAFLYDTSSPDQLTIIGTIAARAPHDEPLLKLNVDLAGVFRADPFFLSLRASLRDSTLAGIVLLGDAAFQLDLGEHKELIVSLGGFHPAFTPPRDFPILRRLEVSLPSNDFVQLSLKAYLAVTPNTLQFGAMLHFWAGISGLLGVEGDAEFHALVTWIPLHFDASLRVHVSVELAGTRLFGADIRGTLSGPGPWRVDGGVYIEVAWWEVEIYTVHAQFGSDSGGTGIPAIDVLTELINAMSSGASWRSILPPEVPAVVLRPMDTGGSQMFLHPSGDAEMTQSLAPLEIQLDRVGTAQPSGEKKFSITNPSINLVAATPHTSNGFFAPAQYLDLSDDEKLSRPSFESMPAGVRLDASAGMDAAVFAKQAAMDYETIPPELGPYRPGSHVIDAELLSSMTQLSFWSGPKHPVTIVPPKFVISSTSTLAVDSTLTPPGGFSSRTQAAQTLHFAAGVANLQVEQAS
jgi:hypothetical protein